MTAALGRHDYEQLKLISPIDRKHLSEQELAELVDGQYPKSTEGAALELRERGIDANPSVLDYLIKKGHIKEPKGDGGRSRRWSKVDIDRAFDYLDEQQAYVPGTVARKFLGIDAAQDLKAQMEALQKHPELGPDMSRFVMEIMPHALGVGVPSMVRYRPMTAKEEADLRDRLAQARKAVAR